MLISAEVLLSYNIIITNNCNYVFPHIIHPFTYRMRTTFKKLSSIILLLLTLLGNFTLRNDLAFSKSSCHLHYKSEGTIWIREKYNSLYNFTDFLKQFIHFLTRRNVMRVFLNYEAEVALQWHLQNSCLHPRCQNLVY